MVRTFIREKKIFCGDHYREVDIFGYTTAQKNAAARGKRSKKVQESEPKQKNLNDKNARRYFVQLGNLNFGDDPEALHVTATYSAKHLPRTVEAAEKEVSNYLRRVAYKAACRAIKAAGYATDPQYADKLIQIVENYSLTAYDGAGSATAPAGRPGASGGSNDTGGAGSPADGKGTGKMNASEFIKKLQDVVNNHATLYVMGCFGAPLTGANVSRYCGNHSYNKKADRTAMIRAAANKKPPVFGFDCVCLPA